MIIRYYPQSAQPIKANQGSAPGSMTGEGKKAVLKDEKGSIATVAIANVFQSNGVIHTVVMPN